MEDHTQTNSTLDSSPDTFPLNRAIYADFSHDNEMIAIFAALGLFRQPEVEPLDPTSPHKERIWRVGEMVPFSGRMIVERLDCKVPGSVVGELATAVRILVNDRVQPMTFCGDEGDGICDLDAFVRSQAYARHDGEGDWDKCFSRDE